jgi:UDP-N-acetylmuramoylalanine--D-glutamate ligase
VKFDLAKFDNKDVIFIGHGREGVSFEKFIKQYGKVRSFSFIDQKDGPNYLEKLDKLPLDETIVVKTAGVPGKIVPVPYTTPTNVFFDLVENTGAIVVGVTGTKGKSTTASLIHHILQAGGKRSVLCGNIGKPMIDYLDQASPQTIFVLELGAYQTADLTKSPGIALIINLFHEHLDYFGSEEAYYDAKYQLLANLKAQDFYVYNPEFTRLAAWADQVPAKKVALDLSKLNDIDMDHAGLKGEHNRKNILAAQTIASLLGVDEETIRNAPLSFTPLDHRLQLVTTVNDISYYDDAISTTPQSTIAAIETVKDIGCILLGGQDRGYDFSDLGKTLAEYNIPSLVFFPDSGYRIKKSLPKSYKPKMLETSDMATAVLFATNNSPKNAAVLLSTASPSYSLWKDFEEKGNQFKAAVNSL